LIPAVRRGYPSPLFVLQQAARISLWHTSKSGKFLLTQSNHPKIEPATLRDAVLAYYTETAADYRVWSKNLNMHLGFWRWGINPLNRERMLEEMNRQVVQRLGLSGEGSIRRLVDLGGGTGATARTAVSLYPDLIVDVVTLVPRQIEMGEILSLLHPGGTNIRFHCVDYAATRFPDASVDAVCMLESACHAEGPTKLGVLREACRILKPGGTFLMVDGMLVRGLSGTHGYEQVIWLLYRHWCRAWAVPEMCRLDQLPAALQSAGFEPPHIEDWSWRVAWSVIPIPLFAGYFALVEFIRARGRLSVWRKRHIVASLLTPWLGICRGTFIYAAVLTRKRHSG